ncbi:AAA family ATPase [Citricoccus sp.]|mgnify:CR=1 FL=1|uniref:AAA family ATPase n=1 Tax=Citricoccus sp. TaxID=1978372 RepID=UPI002B8460AC|nr:AAA family ATPase [Citricoccus sp.]HRO31383.1 AAA family ATPase [Citricoccus sp.]
MLLGIDGSGKTTTAVALAAAERDEGRRALVVRNRSGRRWLIRAGRRAGTELPVRWADRIETAVRTCNVALSHLRAASTDGLVVMDRHLVCQLVLRQVRGLPPGRVLPWLSDRLLRRATVVLLDVPAETAHARITARGEDDEHLDFLRASRAAYLRGASRGWAVVDATGPTREVLGRIHQGAAHRPA